MRQQETATQRLLDARDARARLEAAVATRYDEYLDTLDASARAVEEERATRLVGGAGVGFNWSRRGTVKALWSRHLRVPVELSGSAGEKAAGFLDEYAALFGLAGTPGVLEVSQLKARAQGEGSVIRYRQQLFDLPVFRAHLLLHVGAEGDIEHVAGLVVPEDAVTKQEPRLSATEAAALIGGDAATAQLGWFDPEAFGLPHDQVALAWRVTAAQAGQSIEAYIDAETGKVLQRRDLGSYDKHLEIFYYCDYPCDESGAIKYDTYCHTPPDEPVCPVSCPYGRCEDLPYPGSVASALNSTNATDIYFRERHSRDSWDNAQCQVGNPDCPDPKFHRMRVTTDHPGLPCSARWNNATDPYFPKAQVEAGSGWTCLDTIAHEFTHGIDSVEGKIAESGQYRPASIGEAFGDVLGEMVEEHHHGSGPDWIHSTSCTCGSPPNKRNLGWPVAPGYEQPCPSGNPLPAPDNLANYRDDCESGGTTTEEHFNATILGRAGFLMSRDPGQGSESNWGMQVTGVGISQAGDVWYAALTDYASANDTEPYGMAKLALSSGCESVFSIGAGYDHCLTAISSAGLWSLQDDTGITRAVDGVVSVSYLPNYLYPMFSGYRLFYKEAGTNNLYFRRWSCFPWPCGWKYETQIAWDATTAPTSVAWDPSPVQGDERIEVFYRNTASDIRRIWIDASGWHFWAWPLVVSTTEEPPSAAVSNDTIFLTFKRSWTTPAYQVQWVTYDETNGWQGSFGAADFVVSHGAGPVLTSGDEDPAWPAENQLYIVYSTSPSDGRLAYRAFNFVTQSWSAESLVGSVADTANGRPTARVFRGNLHIAAWHRVSPTETELRYITGLNPYAEWSFYGPIEGDVAAGAQVSLTVSTNGLLLWNVPANSAQGELVSRAKQSQ